MLLRCYFVCDAASSIRASVKQSGKFLNSKDAEFWPLEFVENPSEKLCSCYMKLSHDKENTESVQTLHQSRHSTD